MNWSDRAPIFDHRAVALHRRRARRLPSEQRFLHDEIRSRLLERLGDIRRRFSRILDLGSLDEVTGRADLDKASGGDASPAIVSLDPSGAELVGSAELLPFKMEAFDLIFSALGLQWIDDLPGALTQIRYALEPDGLLLAAIFGGRTLHELRDVLLLAEIEVTGGGSPRVAPFVDLQTAAGLLQRAGLALPVADLETITVTYPTMFQLLAELRAIGETNAQADRVRHFMAREIVTRAATLYSERYPAPGGRITATFDVIMLAGWSPSPVQPQPLRRGSAKHSLAAHLERQ